MSCNLQLSDLILEREIAQGCARQTFPHNTQMAVTSIEHLPAETITDLMTININN